MSEDTIQYYQQNASAFVKGTVSADMRDVQMRFLRMLPSHAYIGNVHRHEMIYKYYCKYASKRALGFCCSREHAEEMARDFLEASGKGFFVQKEGYTLALRKELGSVIHDPAFVAQVKDVIDYRVMDYYQRRYTERRQAED